MMMKRDREGSDLEDLHTMANYLMLLSGTRSGGGGGGGEMNRVFECKTCSRQFSSFQALGGHRASHKKPRLTAGGDQLLPAASPPKPKTHECSICGLEFPIGQALGGHMRRHRSATAANDQKRLPSPELSLSPPFAPIVKKSNSRRVLCLDLNLTPSENKFMFGNVAPAVDCLFWLCLEAYRWFLHLFVGLKCPWHPCITHPLYRISNFIIYFYYSQFWLEIYIHSFVHNRLFTSFRLPVMIDI